MDDKLLEYLDRNFGILHKKHGDTQKQVSSVHEGLTVLTERVDNHINNNAPCDKIIKRERQIMKLVLIIIPITISIIGLAIWIKSH